MNKQIFLIVTFSFLIFAQNNTTNAATNGWSSTAKPKVYSEEATAAVRDELTKPKPDLDELRKAFSNGANPNGIGNSGNPFICTAYMKYPNNLELLRLLELLLDYGANPNSMYEDGDSLLEHPCLSNAIEVMQLFLERQADPNQPDKHNVFPLTIACTKKNLVIIELLLSYGANPIKALEQLTRPYITKGMNKTTALEFLPQEVLICLYKNLSDINPAAAPFRYSLGKIINKKIDEKRKETLQNCDP